MYSFGASREVYNKVYLEHNPTKELNVPGPGAYKPKSYVGETYKYSMRPKTNDIRIEITLEKINNVPGPVAYNSIQAITANGDHFNSLYRSTSSYHFNPPNSSRFKTKCKIYDVSIRKGFISRSWKI